MKIFYRCTNCDKLFSKDTCIEPISDDFTEQLKVAIKQAALIDTATDASYPLYTLHCCTEGEYGMGIFNKLTI